MFWKCVLSVLFVFFSGGAGSEGASLFHGFDKLRTLVLLFPLLIRRNSSVVVVLLLIVVLIVVVVVAFLPLCPHEPPGAGDTVVVTSGLRWF